MKTYKNTDKIVIEYTCHSESQRQEFISSFVGVSGLYKKAAGFLSSDPDDLTILFETCISNFADVFYYMGAMAERRTQHNNFQFKITFADEKPQKEPVDMIEITKGEYDKLAKKGESQS